MGKKSPQPPAPAPHRGRWQAQGPDTEESVPWNRDAPPTKSEMLAMLEQLWMKLTEEQRNERQMCYDAAKAYIANAAATGIDARFAIVFRNRKLRRGVRIDLEIWAGTACIDDPI